MIDKWTDIAAAIVSLLVATYIGRHVWLGWKQAHDRKRLAVVIDSLLFTMFLTVYFIFRVEDIAYWIDAQLPWNNVSRFLAYVCVSWATYFLNRVVGGTANVLVPARQRLYPWAVTVVLCLFFIFDIAGGPSAEGNLPTRISDLIFRVLLYVYVFSLLLGSLPTYLRILREERAFITRLRLLLTILSLSAALSLAGVKCVASVTAYLVPNSPLLSPLDIVSSILKILIVFPFALTYLPKRSFLLLGKPYFYVQSLLILRDLKIIEKRVHLYCTPVSPEVPAFWQLMADVDYYIHRSLVHILDGYKNLAGYLSPPTDYNGPKNLDSEKVKNKVPREPCENNIAQHSRREWFERS